MSINSSRYLVQFVDMVRRIVNWISRTEICMFICVSGILLTFCIIESILHPDGNDDSLEMLTLSNDSSILQDPRAFSSSPFENMSTFIPSVIGLAVSLFFLWKFIMFILFGGLKATEYVPISKSLFRFVIFRFIILSGAINPVRLTSLFGWLVYFSLLGFLHMFSFIINSRCNQISASGFVTARQWIRMIVAFLFIFVGNFYLLKNGLENCFLLADIDVTVDNDLLDNSRASFVTGFKSPTVLGALKSKVTGNKALLYDAVDIIVLLISEFALLICSVSHMAFGLLTQAYDRWRLSKGYSWTYQSTIMCYSDLIFVCFYHLIEISHYLHLLLWSRVFSVASLVVFLHIRVSYSTLAACISRYLAQRRLSKYIANNYELCKSNDVNILDNDCLSNKLSDDENNVDVKNINSSIFDDKTKSICAICWDTMTLWRRLPCRHDFHEHCLRAWLEQNPSCPTCRMDLGVPLVLFSNQNRTQRSENVVLGMLIRNLFNSVGSENIPNQQNRPDGQVQTTLAPNRLIQQNQISGIPRLFSAAIGLNFGLSIGSTSMVTGAAQTTPVNIAPSDTNTLTNQDNISNRSSQISFGTETQATEGLVDIQTPDENDNNGHVRRRTFHFDGSRYFSWLPSLHVELSEVFREVFQMGGRLGDFVPTLVENNPPSVQPNGQHFQGPQTRTAVDYELSLNRRMAVDQLAEMFPQFSRAVIINELLNTGLLEIAAENLMARPLPPTTTTINPDGNFDRMNHNISLTSHDNELIQRNHSSAGSSISTKQSTYLPTVYDPEYENLPTDNSFISRRKVMLAKARRLFLTKHYIPN